MKKRLLLAVCLILAMCTLTACANKESEQDTNTITIGVPKSSVVTDFDDNGFTLWLEEQTGYNIEFKYYAYSNSDYMQQISTEVATDQKLPDILWGFALSDVVFKEYGRDGYLMDLTPLLEDKEKSKVFWDQMENLRETGYGDFADRVWLMMHEDSRSDVGQGPIYVYPTVKTSLVDIMEFNPFINITWLQKLGLQKPTTPDELYDVLVAFRDRDPNGNGKKDEVPMLGCKTDQLSGNTIEWLINFFVYYNDTYYGGLNIDEDGKLYSVAITEEYRDALKWIKRLIDEKLLSSLVLDYTAQDLKSLFSSTDRVGVTVGQPMLIFNNDVEQLKHWQALDVYNYCYFNEQIQQRRTFITTDCVNVDAAWEILMTMSTWEGAVRQRYGVKGVDWDPADPGVMTGMGEEATVKVYKNIWGVPGNESWKSLQAGFFTYDSYNLVQAEDPGQERMWVFLSDIRNHQLAAIARTEEKLGKEQIAPWMRLNQEEEATVPYAYNMNSEILKWRAYFLKGDKGMDINNDTHWAQYIAELEEMGLRDYVKAYQTCYDRMYPNGHV